MKGCVKNMFNKTSEVKPRVATYYRVGSHQQLMRKGLKVVCYARSKTRKELDEQVKKLREYCERERFEIIDVQQELCEGRSDHRLPLYFAIKNKKADAIVVTDFSKISRDMEFAIEVMGMVNKHNKFLINATVGTVVETEVPLLKMIFQS